MSNKRVADSRLIPIVGEICRLQVGDNLVTAPLLGLVQRVIGTVDEIIRRRVRRVEQRRVSHTTGNRHLDSTTTGQFEWTRLDYGADALGHQHAQRGGSFSEQNTKLFPAHACKDLATA